MRRLPAIARRVRSQPHSRTHCVRQRTEPLPALAYPCQSTMVFPVHLLSRNKTMGVNADYIARMKTQLKRWDAEVDALAARCERADAEVRDIALERIKDLRARRDLAQKAYRQKRAAGEAGGAPIEVGPESARKAMQKALGKVSPR